MEYSLEEILAELNRRQNENYYQDINTVNKYGQDPFAPKALNFEDFLSGADTEEGRTKILTDIQPYDIYQTGTLGIGGKKEGIGSYRAIDLLRGYFEANPLAAATDATTTTPTPTMEALTADQAAQLGQIPGIGTNVTGIMEQTSQIPGLVTSVGTIGEQTSQIPGMATDVGTILGQTGQIGDIATDVTGLGTSVAGLGTSLGTLGNRLGVSAPDGDTYCTCQSRPS